MPNSALDANSDWQIKQSIELLKGVSTHDLLGVYLYGSSIFGGLQRYSDLDLFVVLARSTTYEEKVRLAKNLLSISGFYRGTGKRPIEMTTVVQSEVNPWRYPPGFDFQYGEWLRSEFESGNAEPWPTKIDLALITTQVLLASRTLYGEEPSQLLAQVPYKDFMAAITEELGTLRLDLESDTRNVLLTLARIWRTIETDSISSKQKAAQWAIKQLPKKYKPAMERALKSASGEQEDVWDDTKDILSECADFMVGQIQAKIKSLETPHNDIKTITLDL